METGIIVFISLIAVIICWYIGLLTFRCISKWRQKRESGAAKKL